MNEMNNLCDEVRELAWAIADEVATDEQVGHLEHLLVEDEEARRIYVECMQMHADLHCMFRTTDFELPPAVKKAIEAQKAAASRTPLPLVNLPPTGSTIPLSSMIMP
jgi:hypothetical protein